MAERARSGGISLGALDRATLRHLKQQLLAPAWDLDAQGRRKVEPKDQTKEKHGRSPDDADAFPLAYYETSSTVPTVIEPQRLDRDLRLPFAPSRGGRGWRQRPAAPLLQAVVRDPLPSASPSSPVTRQEQVQQD